MIRDRRKAPLRAAPFAGLVAAALMIFVPQASGQSATAPHYTPKGELLTPSGFETWVFVGSNLGLGYKDDLAVTTAQERARRKAGVPQHLHRPGSLCTFRGDP